MQIKNLNLGKKTRAKFGELWALDCYQIPLTLTKYHSGICDCTPESYLRLKQTLFKHPLKLYCIPMLIILLLQHRNQISFLYWNPLYSFFNGLLEGSHLVLRQFLPALRPLIVSIFAVQQRCESKMS